MFAALLPALYTKNLDTTNNADPVLKDVDSVLKNVDSVLKNVNPVRSVSPVLKDVNPVLKDVDPVLKDADPMLKDVDPVLKDANDDFAAFKLAAESLSVPSETPRGAIVMEETAGIARLEGVVPTDEGAEKPTADKVAGIIEHESSNHANTVATVTSVENCETQDDAVKKSRFVSAKDFELLKVIGMGAFGKVLQVRNKKSRQVLAMKVISKRLLRRKTGYVENIQAERNILTKVRHPFVVKMHCSFQTREKLFIIMDFLAGGELFLKIGREGIFLEKAAAFYLAEMILALDHLHTLGILHRDLKPENVLLGADGHIRLTDFGLAKDFSDDGGFRNEEDDARALTICGTKEYMAPEMIARKGYGRAADYWSLGCIAYEMLSGEPPFQSKLGAKDLYGKIMSERVKMPPGSTPAACKILKGLLNRNVQARWGTVRSTMFEVGGVAALRKADFFKTIDWEKLERKEIEPPNVFAVSGDEDLQHFHKDFTNMALPRSVLEMSKDDYKAHKVASNMFRGFSFVQDDFHLPERDLDEIRSYWDSIQEDGESLSDCASSKADLRELMPERPYKPDKKKKLKKKKAAVGGLISADITPAMSVESTPVPSRAPSPIPRSAHSPVSSVVDDPLAPKAVGDKITHTQSEDFLITLAQSEDQMSHQYLLSLQVDTPSTLPPKKKKEVWQGVPTSKKTPRSKIQNNGVAVASSTLQTNGLATLQTQSKHSRMKDSLSHSESAGLPAQQRGQPKQQAGRSFANSVNKYQQGYITQQHPTMANHRQQTQRLPSSVEKAVSKPKVEGIDWPQSALPLATNSSSHSQSRNVSGNVAAKPSSDWRQHSMSPGTLHTIRNVQDIKMQQPIWPSLSVVGKKEACRSPTSSFPMQSTNKAPTTQLKGDWATRAKR